MKDHLGNTRLMFCDRNGDGVIKPENAPEASEVTQENSYYAFGMNMEFGAWENTPSVTDNLKQYNGKELNTDFGLNWNDYGARFYDPATARWNVMDPMAEKYQSYNPYNYASNNPLRNIDIKGDSAWSVVREWNNDDKENFAKFAESRLKEYEDSKTNIDCADLSLSVLVEYASENGLPLLLSNSDGSTSFDSNSDKYDDVGTYKSDVLGGLKAKDISQNTFAVEKSEKQAGDMVILTAPHNHVANYSHVADTNTPGDKSTLTYGNLVGGKPDQVKTTGDWSNSDQHGVYKYNPDKSHVNRWNVLKQKN